MLNPKYKHNPKKIVELPPIPEKLYFTIGEVGKLCVLRPHVLRYWEQEFNQLSPSKRRGNRRYYQFKDVVLIRKIRHLLYEEGYTIEGARQQLNNSAENDNKPIGNSVFARILSDLEKIASELESY